MAEFSQIQSIQTLVSDCKEHAKACIKLRVAGAAETLSITCSSLDQAESLADLIDGYCRLVTGSNTSLWNRKGKNKRDKNLFYLFIFNVLNIIKKRYANCISKLLYKLVYTCSINVSKVYIKPLYSVFASWIMEKLSLSVQR